jgi:mannose-1-phosphate guanylyltransferase
MLYASIMAGGSGTRLWPVSRKSSPKQVKPFLDDKTLLQKTHERLLGYFEPEHIIIATNEAQVGFIHDQIPAFPANQMFTEPFKRDTAAAIGLATLRLFVQDPESFMININSDAYIIDTKEYLRVIESVGLFLRTNPNYIVGIGISPTYPETGYGYIKKGVVLESNDKDTIYKVSQFTEKPDAMRAAEYISSGEYLWNPTLFAWKCSHMLEEFEKHAPEIYKVLMQIKPFVGTGQEAEMVKKYYENIPAISIDYAIFEKSEHMAVIPAQFGWSDVGSWRTIYDLQEKDKHDNVCKGDVITINSKNNLIYSESGKVISVVGLNNFVVIDTPEALLICDKNDTQSVKSIVNKLKDKNMDQYL